MKKKKIVKAAELAAMAKPKPKSRQAVYKNKNLPYIDIEGEREYDLNDPIIKKWLKGESIIPKKKPVKVKKRKPVVKKKSSKKVVNKDYDYLKNNLPVKEHKLLNDLIGKFPGLEKGMATAAKKIKKKIKKKTKTGPKKDIIIPPNFDIPDELKALTDSGQLTFKAAMELSKRDLERIKIYEQIKDIKSKADKTRDGLIDRKLVKTVFSKFYEIDMNQIIPMKEKLIPDIAAIFEVKNEKMILKAGKKLDDALWKILENIKIEKNKFLVKIGEKEI